MPPKMPLPTVAETHKDEKGIARLERRVAELEAFDPIAIQQRWSPEVRTIETSLEESLAWVFGHNTIEYKRYYAAAKLDNGVIEGRSTFSGGVRNPPHKVQGYLKEGKQKSLLLLRQAIKGIREELADAKPLSAAETYIPQSIQTPMVFIGHGRSLVWHQLKEFLGLRLRLACDEFNSESVAGTSTTERLQTLLKGAGFAFLVMTAEDTHADDSTHARENVIHEAGLFQGRLGFKRAIILLV